ncbi:MAG: hypothetical protein M0C28_39390 [Candidatus Moduliflexus flocculans]|nr:hypothetical protein [Candidatus Moduliflexus flocculans]
MRWSLFESLPGLRATAGPRGRRGLLDAPARSRQRDRPAKGASAIDENLTDRRARGRRRAGPSRPRPASCPAWPAGRGSS